MNRTPRMPATVALLLATTAASPPARAGTRTFSLESAVDLAAGEADGVLIGPGDLRAGYAATQVKVDAAAVWCALQAPDGTVYLGTGDDGRLLAESGGRVREIARFDAVMVTSLAWGADTLYAGTMPKGLIYAIDHNGRWREFAKLPAQDVWALVWDAGTLYAATGPEGKLFAIDRNGQARVHFDSDDEHLLSLAPAPGGLYAGSSDSAVLYRVDRGGRAFAVHDFDGDEVRALSIGPGGVVFAAVNDFEDARGGMPMMPSQAPKPGPSDTPGAISAAPAPAVPSPPRRPGERQGKGAVFRVDPDGNAERLHSLDSGYFTALQGEADGSVWEASGTDGRVYFVDAARQVYTALDVPERQVLALALRGSERIVGTGDAGAVYRIGRGAPARPEYRSRVLDASFPARWGKVRWHASGMVLIHTRSGNTATPGPMWSPWEPLRANGGTGGEFWGVSTSPSARYLQIRTTWPGGSSARVGGIGVYFLPQNQRARVVEVTTESDGTPPSGIAKGPAAPATPAPIVKIRWKTDNPDGDALSYRLSYREDTGAIWQPLGGQDPLDKPEYDWNTQSVADGRYRVRVVASDTGANPPDVALEDARVSELVLVDNRNPEIRSFNVGGGRAAGRAVDETSPIQALQYSVDGGPWQPIAPTDGLFDDRVEDFSFRLPGGLPAGSHSLAVRARDEAGNVGVGAVVFR